MAKTQSRDPLNKMERAVKQLENYIDQPISFGKSINADKTERHSEVVSIISRLNKFMEKLASEEKEKASADYMDVIKTYGVTIEDLERLAKEKAESIHKSETDSHENTDADSHSEHQPTAENSHQYGNNNN